MKTMLLGVVSAALLASGASAQYRTWSGAGGAISDMSGQRFTLFVPSHDFEVISFFQVDIEHTFVGDLYISVTHKTTTPRTYVLLDRPGVPQSQFGNGDDLNGVYEFRDGFAPIPENAGTSGVIAPGTYGPNAGTTISGAPEDLFGEWSIYISDNAGGDAGVLRGWSLWYPDIPTPGSVALLGLAGICSRRRR